LPVPAAEAKGIVMGWWLVMLLGILGVSAGVIVLAWPEISLVTLAWVSGIFLLVDGVSELVVSLSRRAEGRGLLALLGALSVIAGLFLVRHPIAGVVAVALLLGIWLVVFGLVRFVEAFGRVERHRVWDLVIAAVEIIAGVIIVATPSIGVAALALIVGIGFVLRGLGTTMLAWALRDAEDL
jgi:uncharacterized membrane protein HdeD (DUF308 family)